MTQFIQLIHEQEVSFWTSNLFFKHTSFLIHFGPWLCAMYYVEHNINIYFSRIGTDLILLKLINMAFNPQVVWIR